MHAAAYKNYNQRLSNHRVALGSILHERSSYSQQISGATTLALEGCQQNSCTEIVAVDKNSH